MVVIRQEGEKTPIHLTGFDHQDRRLRAGGKTNNLRFPTRHVCSGVCACCGPQVVLSFAIMSVSLVLFQMSYPYPGCSLFLGACFVSASSSRLSPCSVGE